MEDNFFYIAAIISVLAIALFVTFIYINIKLRSNWNNANKLNIISISLASVFEVLLLVVSGLIFKNVIINIYIVLFLVTFIILLAAELTYLISYQKYKKEYWSK